MSGRHKPGVQATWAKEQRKAWLQLGLCSRCGGERQPTNFRLCKNCRAYYTGRRDKNKLVSVLDTQGADVVE